MSFKEPVFPILFSIVAVLCAILLGAGLKWLALFIILVVAVYISAVYLLWWYRR